MPQQVGDPFNGYGPPPEAYEGLSNDERIELARQVTMSIPPRKVVEDD